MHDRRLQYTWIQLSNMVALVDSLVADQDVDLDEDASTVETSRLLVDAHTQGPAAVDALLDKWESEDRD
jgi:hypothetical protein